GLLREAGEKRDLLVAKQTDFLAKDVDDSDQLVVLEHRHADCRVDTTEFDAGDGCRIAVGVGLGRCKVGKMGGLLRSHYLAQRATRGRTERAAAAHLSKCYMKEH